MKNRLEDNRCLFFLANSGKNNFFLYESGFNSPISKNSPQKKSINNKALIIIFKLKISRRKYKAICIIA